MRFLGRGALLALMVAVVSVSVSEVEAEEWSQNFTVSEDALRLANLIGEIQVEGHRGSDFEIEVHVRGEDASRDAIRIEEQDGRNATLAVVFPVDREKNYVYPPMGNSNSSFSMSSSSQGWWKEVLGFMTGDKIKVSGKGRGMEIWADVTVRVPSGGQLLVEHGVGTVFAEGVNGDLDLNTRSGRVEVTALDGELSVDTGSGSVTIENTTGERVTADTGSGGVALRNITCRSLSVDTGSGEITASGVKTGSASLDTGSGGVELALDEMSDGDIDIDTGSGSIHLRLPRSSSARVTASTGSGGVSIDLDDVRMIERSRHEKRFEIGNGGPLINLDTGSGSIRVSE